MFNGINPVRKAFVTSLSLITIAYSLLLAGCTHNQSETDALMDQIEQQLVLPLGADQLDDYGRHYALDGEDTVVGHYIVPLEAPEPDDGCEQLTEEFESIPCDPSDMAEWDQFYANQVKAGERRWFKNERELPIMDDGGCMMVTIEYEISSGKFIRNECNGPFDY